jgi:hypothetical protein
MKLKISTALLALVGSASACYGQSVFGPMVPNTPYAFPLVYDASKFGAVCNGGVGGSSDDAAINSMLNTAAASTAYQNNDAIEFAGPQGPSQSGCVINSLNFTQFNKGNAANPRPRVQFHGFTLLCTGSKNICIDGLNADFVDIHDVSLRGDSAPNSPEIGVQIGVSTTSNSSAWHLFNTLHINGEFSLAALYNGASENFLCLGCFLTNAHSADGPIGSLGSITGGAGGTNGTYPGVALTGGHGSGALATVVVAGNIVSTVTITYEGRDYQPADVLSAASASIGNVTGFSVPISTVSPYTLIMDGQNHWRVASSFTPVTLPAETWTSFTENRFFGGSIRQNGAGKAAIWAARTEGLVFYGAYLYGGASTPSYCVALFDNGLSKSNIPTGNSSFRIEHTNCEGGISGSYFITGANATPVLTGIYLDAPIESASATRPTFVEDTNITGVSMPNATLRVDWYTVTASIMFKTPSLYAITGNAFVPAAANWNSPSSFTGQLCTPTSCVTH